MLVKILASLIGTLDTTELGTSTKPATIPKTDTINIPIRNAPLTFLASNIDITIKPNIVNNTNGSFKLPN